MELRSEVVESIRRADWTFLESSSDSLHALHPYPAKFIPQIPRQLIHLLEPSPETVVLDPFCGCGTTLVEANRAGLDSIGVDLHPLAALISRVKTAVFHESLWTLANAAAAKGKSNGYPIPPIPRLDHWFKPAVQRALAEITGALREVEATRVREALQVALSRIVVRVSNQESDVRYAAVDKNVTYDDVYRLFLESAAFVDSAVSRGGHTLFAEAPASRVVCADLLNVTPEDLGHGVGLVITSPPYPNAYEYWLYHKYRMYWLGMDPLAVREREIGARPHYFKKEPQTEDDYAGQMLQVFILLSRVMVGGGIVCLLIGNSVIHGKEVDNTEILTRSASICGFELVAQVKRTIPKKRKAFNPLNSRIEEESLLVLQLRRRSNE